MEQNMKTLAYTVNLFDRKQNAFGRKPQDLYIKYKFSIFVMID